MPTIVRVSAWLSGKGYITFERYYGDDGELLPVAQGVFHCVRRHAVCPQDLQEYHRLVRRLDTGEYTGVGLVMLMPEHHCPRCRVEKGLKPYDDTGLLTSESLPPEEYTGGTA